MAKIKALLSIAICLYFYSSALSQNTYKGYPVIQATSNMVDYKINNSLYGSAWRIVPKIKVDSLFVVIRAENENFAFYTNTDSIKFKLKANNSYKFYVKLDNKYAFTLIQTIDFKPHPLKYNKTTTDSSIHFAYEANPNNNYLAKLRTKYRIDSLVKECTTDKEKALKILNWVHSRWSHNGSHIPKKSNALYILEQAEKGKQYRCVEYGIVLTACLNSIGLKTRTIALKTKDVETRKSGAGHVASEVYLNDIGKWAFLDGQWDCMPEMNNSPLNAVEFRAAIEKNYSNLNISSLSQTPSRIYIDWIYDYLYYLDIAFDNRIERNTDRIKIDDKSKLMLVPIGAKNPEKFQRLFKISNCLYSNNYNDFYSKPL